MTEPFELRYTKRDATLCYHYLGRCGWRLAKRCVNAILCVGLAATQK